MVLGVASHSETLEKFVAYIHLSSGAGTAIWVRPYDMFFEEVDVKGRKVPRFTYIGEQIEPAVGEWYDHLSGYRGADRDDS